MSKYSFRGQFYHPYTGYLIVAILLFWACIYGPLFAHDESIHVCFPDAPNDTTLSRHETFFDASFQETIHFHEWVSADGTTAWQHTVRLEDLPKPPPPPPPPKEKVNPTPTPTLKPTPTPDYEAHTNHPYIVENGDEVGSHYHGAYTHEHEGFPRQHTHVALGWHTHETEPAVDPPKEDPPTEDVIPPKEKEKEIRVPEHSHNLHPHESDGFHWHLAYEHAHDGYRRHKHYASYGHAHSDKRPKPVDPPKGDPPKETPVQLPILPSSDVEVVPPPSVNVGPPTPVVSVSVPAATVPVFVPADTTSVLSAEGVDLQLKATQQLHKPASVDILNVEFLENPDRLIVTLKNNMDEAFVMFEGCGKFELRRSNGRLHTSSNFRLVNLTFRKTTLPVLLPGETARLYLASFADYNALIPLYREENVQHYVHLDVKGYHPKQSLLLYYYIDGKLEKMDEYPEPVAGAPSLVRPKLITTWGALKQ